MRRPGEPAFHLNKNAALFPVLFSRSSLLEGFWGEVGVACQGARESNAWKHGAFCFLTASGDKAEIRTLAPASNLKQILLVVGRGGGEVGGIQGVKKVKKRGKRREEVARKGNIVNPLSVWRCLFLSLSPPHQ